MTFYELAEKALELERQGKKIIRLNVGDTNLPPPACAVEAAAAALEGNISTYVSSAGMHELREKIAEKEGCDVGNVIINPGSKYTVFSLMSILAEKGDRIAIPTPTWPAYELICRQLGLEAAMVRTKMEDNWNFDGIDLEGCRMLIICNPGNPTSTVYDSRKIEAAVKEANDRGIHVIIDEAYKDLAFERIPLYEGAIRIRSFSKEFNMANWRLGYAIAPEEIAKKLNAFSQITITCIPPFVQKAGIACLENEKGILEENIGIWKRRNAAVQKALEDEGFRFARPQAGMYIFPTHDKIADADAYAMKLLEKGVAVAPGGHFGGYKAHVRICLGTEEKNLEDAVKLMADAL